MDIATNLLYFSIINGGGIVLASIGEWLSERSGVLNLGIEGLMSLGAVTAIIAVFSFHNPWIALIITCGVGAICGIIFAICAIIIKANQVLCGLAFTMLGIGIAEFIGKPYEGIIAAEHLQPMPIPFLSSIPTIGYIVFSQNIMVYLIYIIIPLTIYVVFFKTQHGLNVRAVGENPEAADAVGVPVTRIRFFYSCLGTILGTLAGGYLILASVFTWSGGLIAGQGWIAIALVMLGRYRLVYMILSGVFFGFITAIGFEGQVFNWPIPPVILNSLLYIFAIIFAIFPSFLAKNNSKKWRAPAALCTPFFRSNR
ncbi:ABC-type guanosine uptake system NupNOPQ [Commensalibacter communis]|uniref:ABC transporter permease n=1 Tax=Commensalibacter communis TaxID=2972786 RepID=UPI0022FF8EF0|nr:ABC transporter permease [Commensalibacter communis]CAI3954598.1 ABC-type guanosine uptake system NupNOPQ [Commensalibacter communis]CAI3955336.1 ABC-type guanosine uptake system NupNOPQ [Commensalibacter communis]